MEANASPDRSLGSVPAEAAATVCRRRHVAALIQRLGFSVPNQALSRP